MTPDVTLAPAENSPATTFRLARLLCLALGTISLGVVLPYLGLFWAYADDSAAAGWIGLFSIFSIPLWLVTSLATFFLGKRERNRIEFWEQTFGGRWLRLVVRWSRWMLIGSLVLLGYAAATFFAAVPAPSSLRHLFGSCCSGLDDALSRPGVHVQTRTYR